MNGDDAQALREIGYFASRLLGHAGLLPPELAAMLAEYASGLGRGSPGRWDGVGSPAQLGALAQRIGQSIADEKWPVGTRLDCKVVGKAVGWRERVEHQVPWEPADHAPALAGSWRV